MKFEQWILHTLISLSPCFLTVVSIYLSYLYTHSDSGNAFKSRLCVLFSWKWGKKRFLFTFCIEYALRFKTYSNELSSCLAPPNRRRTLNRMRSWNASAEKPQSHFDVNLLYFGVFSCRLWALWFTGCIDHSFGGVSCCGFIVCWIELNGIKCVVNNFDTFDLNEGETQRENLFQSESELEFGIVYINSWIINIWACN